MFSAGSVEELLSVHSVDKVINIPEVSQDILSLLSATVFAVHALWSVISRDIVLPASTEIRDRL